MVPKESGFNQSVAASGMCARKARRFPCSSVVARDGEFIRRQHFCHHGDTICHPKSGYVKNKLHGTSTCGSEPGRSTLYLSTSVLKYNL